MKKLVLLALLAVSMLATAKTTKPSDAPFPQCNPCDWLR